MAKGGFSRWRYVVLLSMIHVDLGSNPPNPTDAMKAASAELLLATFLVAIIPPCGGDRRRGQFQDRPPQ